jgi:hypothetical protein
MLLISKDNVLLTKDKHVSDYESIERLVCNRGGESLVGIGVWFSRENNRRIVWALFIFP